MCESLLDIDTTVFVEFFEELLLLFVRPRFVVIYQERLYYLLVSSLQYFHAADLLNSLAVSAKNHGCRGIIILFVFAHVGMLNYIVMAALMTAVMILLLDILTLLGLPEEAPLHCRDCGTHEDGSETHQSQGCRHYHRSMFNAFIDTQHKTEGDCSSDDTRIGDEDEVAEFYPRLIPEEFRSLDDADGPDEAPSTTDD